MGRRTPPDVERQIIDLHESGLSGAAIGRRLGMNQSTVSGIIRRALADGRTNLPPLATGKHKRWNLPPPNLGEKVCYKCELSQPLENFWKHKNSKDGLCGACKSCMTEANRSNRASQRHLVKKEYGITLEEYDTLKSKSSGCGICGEPQELQLDHDHVTGKVREFLCGHCNRGLGMFRDSMERLHSAIAYLEKHSE